MTHSDTADGHPPQERVDPGLLPETDLVECLRSGTDAEGQAIRELQRRHLPAVAAYAQLHTTSDPAGRRLAGEAFSRAMEEIREGVDPSGTWRHHALTHVREAALAWAADDRRSRLQPDFLAWAQTVHVTSASEPPNAMASAFYQLPERLRSALWYSVVDDEPHSEVATHLGATSDAVPDLAAKAQVAMRDAYVQEHLSLRGTAECRGFKRIIEAAAQERGGTPHPDLAAHLAHCVNCTGLLSRLTRMSAGPRLLLAEGLLLWGGAAYTERVPMRTTSETTSSEQGTVLGTDCQKTPLDVPTALVEVLKSLSRPRPTHRSVREHRTVKAVGSIAAIVAVATAAAVAAPDVLPESWDLSGLAGPEPSRSADPTPSTTPSRSHDTAPSGDPTPHPEGAPSPVPLGKPSQIVHAATGLCLDVENQVVGKRVNAVAAPCGSGTTQRWNFDTDGHLHNEADPGFCLKVDGDTADVGIRPCTSDDPEKRSRMTFVIDESGEIHSKPRTGQVIVPVGDYTDEVRPVELKESSTVGDKRWVAGPITATATAQRD